MHNEHFAKAYKAGKRDYQIKMLLGQKPTLPVLDDILPASAIVKYEPLGLVQIPLDQIVGTRYEGRSHAFASNFMPILPPKTEFSMKWANLSKIHEEEGIRDPIKVVEYMNKYYVEEGNKRVSVMKYFEAISIPGIVTRLVPKRTDEKENKIYFEYLDFYRVSKINYIWFSKEGSFAKLQKLVGKAPDEMWTDEDRISFKSAITRFTFAYEANGGNKLDITVGDAFLAFLKLYGYEDVCSQTPDELKSRLAKCWEEFRLQEETDSVELKMDPIDEKKSLFGKLFSSKQKIAFLYEKTAASSAWTYSHELGRQHLELTFPDEISTVYYDNITTENIDEYLEKAIADGCNLIFTTTPPMAAASVKAAIAHPDVRILNCSLHTSHKYIRTYYPRMHEAKFIMGAIAGAMGENDRLSYIADYPLLGNIANINAFALAAKMINPRAKVYLEWSSKKDVDISEHIRQTDSTCVSGKDMVIPEEASRYFGLYHVEGEYTRNLAMPLCHWGKFYEQLIRTIMDGTWKYDDNSKKAINYWWGMSAGVVDVICSKSLPVGIHRLVELLKQTIIKGELYPFAGVLYSQTGTRYENPDHKLTPEEIITMDWLAENIVGSIPKPEELAENAIPVINQQGLLDMELTES